LALLSIFDVERVRFDARMAVRNSPEGDLRAEADGHRICDRGERNQAAHRVATLSGLLENDEFSQRLERSGEQSAGITSYA
jgi:hypothetical protein